MGEKKSLFWVHITFTELYWHVWFISPFYVLSSYSLQTQIQTSWRIRKNKASFPSRPLSKPRRQSCSIHYHKNRLFLLLFVSHSWPASLFPEEIPASLVSVCRWHVRKGGALKSKGKELCAALHTVTAGFCWPLFLLFPRVQKQTLLSTLLLDMSIVSIPGWRYLERSLIAFTLSFYTHMSLMQFGWSKHSGTVIFFHSMCTRYLALHPPSSMENIKCFSDINAK